MGAGSLERWQVASRGGGVLGMFWIIAGLVFVAFMMAGAWCSCCGCAIIQDDFTRSNGTDMGTDWTEEAGSWEISTNRAATASSDAILVHGTAITVDDFVVQASVSSSSGNPSARLYVREDADNYICGEYKWDSGVSLWILKIFERVGGGAETELMRVNAAGTVFGSHHSLRLYIDKTNGVVVFTQAEGLLDSVPVVPSSTTNLGTVIVYKAVAGTEIAIGTGTVTGGITVRLDDFRVHPKTVSCGEQIHCCTTQGLYPPEEIQVEITDMVDGGFGAGTCPTCSVFNGTYTLQLRGRYGAWKSANLDGCVWAYELPGTDCSVNWIAVYESTHPTTRALGVYLIRTSANLGENTEVSIQQFTNTDNSRICAGDTMVANEVGGLGSSGELCGPNLSPPPSRPGVATVSPL